MRKTNKDAFIGLLEILIITVALLFPAVVAAQTAPWVQEERMRQMVQRQQWQEWQRQEQMRQSYERQQWLLRQQQEQMRQRFQR
jgi:hypothetical protein